MSLDFKKLWKCFMVTMTTEMIALNEFECFFSVKDIMFVQVYMFHFNTASEKNISFMSETRKND